MVYSYSIKSKGVADLYEFIKNKSGLQFFKVHVHLYLLWFNFILGSIFLIFLV